MRLEVWDQRVKSWLYAGDFEEGWQAEAFHDLLVFEYTDLCMPRFRLDGRRYEIRLKGGPVIGRCLTENRAILTGTEMGELAEPTEDGAINDIVWEDRRVFAHIWIVEDES